MDLEDYHFKLKTSVLGDKSVGKTAIIDVNKLNLALVNNIGKLIDSEESDELSIKVDSLKQTINIQNQGNIFRMQFWEIQSHHKNSGNFFRYCLGSTASIYVFDSTKIKKLLNNTPLKISSSGFKRIKRAKSQSRFWSETGMRATPLLIK